MRVATSLAVMALLAGAPAFAQTFPSPGDAQVNTTHRAARSGTKPIDHGPFTAQANGAYMGGGEILQGAPGAPPPRPVPAPPGQAPGTAAPQ